LLVDLQAELCWEEREESEACWTGGAVHVANLYSLDALLTNSWVSEIYSGNIGGQCEGRSDVWARTIDVKIRLYRWLRGSGDMILSPRDTSIYGEKEGFRLHLDVSNCFYDF
jgi:hypothetical protein